MLVIQNENYILLVYFIPLVVFIVGIFIVRAKEIGEKINATQKFFIIPALGHYLKTSFEVYAVMILLMPLLAWSMNHVLKESMIQLRQQGWKVEEKKSFVESRPGKRPYQMLKRDVQVVLYPLHRQKQELFCRVEYDSQQDTIREMCSKDENILESIVAD